jgi:hypothetical protein
MSFFGIDSTTLLTIFSACFTAILVVFAIFQIRLSRELALASNKLASVTGQLQTTTLVVDEHTKSLTEATQAFSAAVQTLSAGTQTLAKIESEPRLGYVQGKKDLKLGGVEFELVNNGKGTAHSVKVTPHSAKGARMGVSFLNIQKSDISVGEGRKYLLTAVKQGDLVSLTTEFKDSFGSDCTPLTFEVDTN